MMWKFVYSSLVVIVPVPMVLAQVDALNLPNTFSNKSTVPAIPSARLNTTQLNNSELN